MPKSSSFAKNGHEPLYYTVVATLANSCQISSFFNLELRFDVKNEKIPKFLICNALYNGDLNTTGDPRI